MYRILLSLLLAAGCISASGQGVRTVVIDPGHGGTDPGCVWGSLYEKNINLEVALMLGGMIKEEMPGVRVVYTRTTDVKVGLADRGKLANASKADLFVSIHVNATDKSVTPPSGALTLVMGKQNEGNNLDMARRENDVISYEDDYTTTYKEYLSGSSEMFIIYSMMQYVNIDKSIHFANSVQRHLKSSTPMADLGIRRQQLVVLSYATVPGVLVELGFINNSKDRDVLTSTDGKRGLAGAILDGIKEFRVGGEGVSETPAPSGRPVAKPKPVERPREPIIVDVPSRRSDPVPPPRPVIVDRPAPATSPSDGGNYTIQILSTTRKVPASSPELRGWTMHEKYSGGRYRYYTGQYTSRAAAERALVDVRRTFKDAFIVSTPAR